MPVYTHAHSCRAQVAWVCQGGRKTSKYTQLLPRVIKVQAGYHGSTEEGMVPDWNDHGKSVYKAKLRESFRQRDWHLQRPGYVRK